MHISSRKPGLLFSLMFAGIWTLVTAGFDAFIGVSIARQAASSNYPETKGYVTASEVTRHSGSKGGTTYGVALAYTYGVDGKAYTCDRYSYGDFSSSDHARAEAIVAANPVGAEVTVHYNPRDPADATLRTGVERSMLFLMIFMTPFNIIMLGAWWGVLATLLRRSQPACAGFVRSDDASRAVLRFTKFPAIAGAAAGMLGVSFASIFVVGFISGFEPSMGMIAGAWFAILGAGVVGFAWRAWRIASGRYTLVIDRVSRRIRLPRRGHVNEYAIERSDELPFGDVASIDTPVDHNRKTNNQSTRQLHLRLRTPGVAEPIVLAKWMSEAKAQDAASWLRAELGIAPPPDGAAATPA
jgi:hypothetical protein